MENQIGRKSTSLDQICREVVLSSATWQISKVLLMPRSNGESQHTANITKVGRVCRA